MRLFNRLTIFGKAMVIAVALVIIFAGLVAAGVPNLPFNKFINGQGTITVQQPPTVAASYDLTVNTVGPLDFGGAVALSGDTYSKTVQVSVTNSGVNGSNPVVSAAINGVTSMLDSTPVNWPEGATLGGFVTGPIAPGATVNVPVTLSVPNVTGTVTLPAFTIRLVCN